MVTPDSVSSLETKLLHYESEILMALVDPDYDPTNLLPLQDAYFYGCTLVDQCLARHLVPVEGDDHRKQSLARLSIVNPRFLPVRARFTSFDEGFQFRMVGSPIPSGITVLTDFSRLLFRLVAAVVRVCPS